MSSTRGYPLLHHASHVIDNPSVNVACPKTHYTISRPDDPLQNSERLADESVLGGL